MDDVTLEYGDQKLHLEKSPDYIAVKPRVGVDPHLRSQVAPEVAAAGPELPTLGGFQADAGDPGSPPGAAPGERTSPPRA